MSDLSKRFAALSPEKQDELMRKLRQKSAAAPQSTLVPRPRNVPSFPLSFAQQRLWFIDQLEPQNPLYNIPMAVRLEGELNLPALRRCLDELVRRHEVLRTSLLTEEAGPVQVIAPPAPVPLTQVDLRPVPEAQREAEALRLGTEELNRPFTLSAGPLVRATLLQLSEREHVLLLTMHHVVSDGWSRGILIRELMALYTAFAQGKPSPLPELPLQYVDYACWQREWLQGQVLETQLAYWRKQLAEAPRALELPTDRPHPAMQSFAGARLTVLFPRELGETLKALGQKEGATAFMVLLAAWQVLLARYSGQSDISVGTPIAGRTRAELEGLIGFFVNTLVLRTKLEGNPTFRELLARVRETTLGAYAHQDVPFEKLVEELKPERDMSRSPLFQVLFSYQNGTVLQAELPGLRLRSVEPESRTAKFDLSLDMAESEQGLAAVLEYNTDLFDASTAARMVGHLRVLLEGIAANPDARVRTLPLLTEAERQTLVGWNDTRVERPANLCLHRLIEEQVERSPDAVAVDFEGARLTYRELDARANQLARHLRALGVGPEVRVGLCLERSLELVVGLLGVLKAGGAYVPIDPGYPAERLAYMVEDAAAPVLLTQQRLVEKLPSSNATVVCLDTGWEEIARQSVECVASGTVGSNLAYIIYTSGSTGRPKGAMNSHEAICNRLLWMQEAYGLGAGDRVLQKTPFSFDVSVWEFFWPLMMGARLVVAKPGGHQDAAYLVRLMEQEAISTVHFVPSMLQVFLEEAGLERLSALERVICSGEALPAELKERCLEKLGAELHNLYGPTEAAVDVTAWACERGDGRRSVPIGRPVANTRIHILDAQLRPVPVGVAGELYIGGVQVGRGYLKRPELTAERFIPNPLSQEPGERLYRTGDLARYAVDGSIEYLGRVDFQVKVRGFRIELGEIESALEAHPAVREVVVVAREDVPGDKRLVAYVVAKEGQALDVGALRASLKERLPEYMVPSVFMVLAALPLSPNGKVERKALPAPESTVQERAVYVAPRTPTEELLAGIWAKVLRLERVGARDNFFELGGHSLLATQVMSRIRAAFGVESLPLRALFEAPTLEQQALKVEEAVRAGHGVKVPPLVAVERSAELPLSFAQQRLWFLDQLEPDSSLYNISTAVRLEGALDVGALQVAFRELVRRHEALRTTFRVSEGQPVQVIAPSGEVPLALVDVSGVDEALREAEVQRLVEADARRPFDLANGPLFRVTLARLSEREHVLVMGMHHIVSDGWSMGVLVREVVALYQALSSGQPSPLPELEVQYADYAAWQRGWLKGEVLESQLGYWRERLKGAPHALELPTDRPRPAVQTYRGSSLSMPLPKPLAESLKALGHKESATPFMVLLAAFQVLLARYSGQKDISVGTPIAGRTRAEMEGLIGFFVNTLVLRTKLDGNPSFREVLARVREAALGAYAHQEVPFEKLVEELKPERDLSRSPLFQVMFSHQSASTAQMELPGLSLRSLEPRSHKAKFELLLDMAETEQGLVAALEYNTDLFDASMAERLLGHLRVLLEGIAARPEARLSELPLLTDAEHQKLVEWNDTRLERPAGLCLHRLIEEQVERTPDAVAVDFEGARLTYRELDARANQLARHLRGLGVGPEVRVGLCLERSLELVVGLLGVLKAGGAYVPIDPGYPAERLAYMVEDAAAPVLLTQQRLVEKLPSSNATVVCLDTGWEEIARHGAERVDAGTVGSNLAYIIYTSGSTGRPKGAMNSHEAICNRLLWMQEAYGLGAGDRVLQKTPFSFDVSVWEFFWPLMMGARLVVAKPGGHQDAAYLVRLMEQEAISTVHFVPSMLQVFLEEAGLERLSSLKRVICSGEALPAELKERCLERLGAELHNLYGPTEAAVDVTAWACERGDGRRSVPIGRPVANTRIHILDAQLRPVPVGVAGELYIGGVQVGRGYLKRPELTAERFIPNPLSQEPGERLYRTGDLARYAVDGSIEYLGRVDFQVKVRGFRIELGEIESALEAHPAVREVVVVAREDVPGDKRLVAYVVAKEGQALDVGALRASLKERLPEYMVPSVFMVLAALPLSPNGKVERKALPAPESTVQERAVYVAPRTPTEELLAGIWAKVLRLERVGVQDNFFELGGHSLLATQVMSRIRAAFGVESLPLRALFEAPTLEQQALKVEEAVRAGHGVKVPPLVAVERSGALPLSFAQQRLWFLDRLEPESSLYNIPSALRLEGMLDVDALARSFEEIVRRHEALRTVFQANAEGLPIQVIAPELALPLTRVDLSGLPEAEREAEARRLAGQEGLRPFDLARGPLLRVTLFHLSERQHLLVVVLHHIVSDGWSSGVLVGELAALYEAFRAGKPSPLPALPVQYADYAVWQREWLQGGAQEAQLSYWRERLEGAPRALELPTDRPRPAELGSGGSSLPVNLSPELSEAVKALARREGVTPYMVLLAGFQVLLSRYSGQEDVSVGTPVAGRGRSELEGLIGLFLNTLVLRTKLEGNPTFRELLSRVRETALGAFAHQDVPFERLVDAIQPERDLGRTPLFQVMFILQNAPRPEVVLPGLTLRPEAVRAEAVKFDLSLSLADSEEGFRGALAYRTDLFDEATVARMSEHLRVLLEGAVAEPRQRLSELPLLSAGERHELLVEWNATREEQEPACIHEWFEAQVERVPETAAVVAEEGRLTYRELNARANQLAHRLEKLGVGPDTLVGLYMERTVEAVVGMLGILKAGGAYVPLDPSYPAERVRTILEDAGARVVVTQSAFEEQLAGHEGVKVRVDGDAQSLASESTSNPARKARAGNLVYAIFTSGSTGRPKGVAIEHRQLANYTRSVSKRLSLPEGASFASVSTLAADLGNTAVFPTLCQGGTLHLVAKERASDPEALGEYMARHGVECLKIVPSHLRALLGAVGAERVLPRKRLVLGGEASDKALIEQVHALAPGCEVYNHYGPTETTVGVLTYPVKRGEWPEGAATLPLGRPIANARMYVLDARMQPVPAGVPGELYVGGECVGRGYLGRPDLTAERFIPDPFSTEPGARLYRTGDRVRHLQDGSLEFLGRVDFQLKVRGYRVELGEVEAALAKCAGVRECVVVAREEAGGNKRLVAYVVPTSPLPSGEGRGEGISSPGLNLEAVRTELKNRLPEYMVPSAIVVLEALPLTANGKVDRKALPAPDAASPESQSGFEAPRNATEELLAGIWAQVLRVARVGIHDNFFALGGDSIISLQIIARAGQAGLRITPKQLFQHQTIAGLAQVATTARRAQAEQGLVTGPVPLTPIQGRFFEQALPEAHHHNQSVMIELRERVEPSLVEKALRELVAHHDALRLRYVRDGAGWKQEIAGLEQPLSLRVLDVSALPEEQQRAALEKAAAEVQGSMKLDEGLLLRALWVERGEGRTARLLLAIQHLAVDGVSWRVLLEDLNTAYQHLKRGEAVVLPRKTTSFQAWARRLESHARTPEVEAELPFWVEGSEQEPRPLPVDKAAGPNTVGSAREVSVSLDVEETRALLREVPTAYRAHINDVLLAALTRAFARWTGQGRLRVELEGHGREELFEDVDVSRTVGWFTAVYPVLLELPAAGSAGDGLRSVRDTLRRVPNRGLGYGLLRYLREDEAGAKLRAQPRAQVIFNYLGQFDAVDSGSTVFGLAREGTGPGRSPHNPRPYLFEVGGLVVDGRLSLTLNYSDNLHERTTVEALARDFLEALRTLIAGRSSEDAARRTPSDFPLARLERTTFERLLARAPGLEDLYPLSPMQQGMLFHTLLEPASGVYFEQRAWSFHAALNLPALKRAWETVVERNPVLRTSFFWEGLDEPLQGVHSRVELPWREFDWRGLPPAEQQAKLEAFLKEDRAQGFELARAPLMRLALIRMDEQVYRLVWSFHHLLTDGWSTALLRKEVFTLYTAFEQGQEARLPQAPAYREYISWLRRQELARTESFWRESLAGFRAPTPLPSGTGVLRHEAARGLEERGLVLSEAETAALQSFARGHQLTLNTLVQAAWALVLGRHSGERDVVFGATVSGRPVDLPGADTMLGMFINTLPVRVRLESGEAVVAWLRRLQTQQLELRQHEHSPLVQVQGWSQVPRGTPLFESILVFENYPIDTTVNQRASSHLDARESQAFERTNYPLTAVAAPERQLLLKLAYETPRFDAASAGRLLEQWRIALQGLVARAGQRLADVPLLAADEERKLVVEWNATRAEYPRSASVHQLFEAQVERTPDAVALQCGARRLTYRELEARANRLANHLRRLGVGPEVRVGLCLERRPEMVVSLLAVLKAGGAYVPLDPTYPSERLGYMVRDAGARVLLTQRALESRLPAHEAAVVRLDEAEATLAAEPDSRPQVEVRPEGLVYVIYTSGSTGRPKGVMVTHGGVVNYLAWAVEAYRLAEGRGAPVHSSFSFDLTVTSLLAPLVAGRAAVLVEEEAGAVEGLGETLRQGEDYSLVKLTPTHLRLLAGQLGEKTAGGRTRAFIIGGEALGYEMLEHWRRYAPGTRLINEYGPTETVVGCVVHEVAAGEPVQGSVPIGRPIANTQLYVLDESLRLVPVGAPGELYVGGDGVGRGYLGRPELTAERFIPDPFSAEPGARMYRTGDLVRYRADGVMEYLGRQDDQVKVRGFRIELGEIESALTSYPSVRECAVLAREDVPGDKRLVAYVVPTTTPVPLGEGQGEGQQSPELNLEAVRTWLKQRLPEYMVPSAFVVLEALPVAPTGKVDRQALPAPDGSRPQGDANYVAPRTPEEELLAGLWAQVLGVEKVGLHDDFFALGGHSLLATQAISRARDVFRVELPLKAIFEAPTVAQLLPRIEAAAQAGDRPLAPPLVPTPRTGELPLSFAQQRLWFLDQLEPGSAFYNVPAAIRLEGVLDVAALERGFAELFRRHEPLRTVFRSVEGRPVQVILPVPEVPLPVVELRELPGSEREAAALRHAHAEAQRPFELTKGPMLRATLLRLDERSHVLLLTMHHIVSDGWSMSVLVREMVALYEAFSTGKSSPLPELAVQYADYATWQREWLKDGALQAQLAYWRQRLEGAPRTLDLPTDRPRPPVQSHKGEHLSVLMPPALAESLHELGRREGVTLFMTLLAGFQLMLTRYSRQTDIVVGTDIANRNRAETEGLIGFFVNQLVMRTDLGGDPTVRELLGRVREASLGAYSHQDLPFEELVKEINPERSLGQAPLFQVKLVLQNAPVSRVELPGLTLSPVSQEATRAKMDLTVAVQDTPHGLACVWEYATDLFDAGTIARMAKHFERVLEGLTASPERRLSSLSLLSAEDRRKLLVEWNDTRSEPLPGPTAHALFEAQAARTPDALAAVFEGESLTYRELDARANQFAWHLRAYGVGPESLVGLCVERSLDMVVGILGILKAGGAYLPLDPSYPSDRLAFMLQDAAVPVLVTQESLADELPSSGELLICLDADWAQISVQPREAPPPVVGPENLAYVIYTSGSTGRPKGTLLHHRGLCNTARAALEALGIQPGSRVLQFAAFGFDASVWEVFSALLAGAELHLAPREKLLPGAPLTTLLTERGITTVTLTPSVLAQLPSEGLPALVSVASAGEACSPELVRRWKQGRRFLNAYGPTEVTVCATVSGEVDADRPTIGRPLPNVRVYVLDARGEPVPPGVPGELCVGGVGLARGYLRRPELTAERFVPDPFSQEPGARLYRTGDLVRYLPSGEVEYLSRIDNQLKLRGYRIELGEIEAVLSTHTALEQAVVLAREDVPGNPRLVAYCVPRAGETLDTRELRGWLQARLPDYMVPAAFAVLEALPLTPNGKLDRRALPLPDASRPTLEKEYVAPRDELEQQLASMWSELLGVEKVGIHDDFFELGGHSLLATQVISRIRTSFEVELPLRDIFEAPTVANLALHIVKAQAAQVDPAELERLMGELEQLSSDEAEALLSSEPSSADTQKVSNDE